jgi:hypothetical protein
MFLYEVYMNNGLNYGDEDSTTVLIVAENMGLATKRANELLRNTFWEPNPKFMYGNPYFYVELVDKVDGYEIVLKKKKVK